MAGFCLMPDAVNRFTNALRDGTIDPYKLNQLTSDERRAIFERVVGDKAAAKEVNAQFEGKMLLKNQKYAYTAWAKKLAGITPETKRDLASKIDKLDRVLNPEEEKQFLHDLAAKKLGVEVTANEAKNITNLAEKVKSAETAQLSSTEDALKRGFTPSASDLEYGRAKYDLQKYVSDLKNNEEKFFAGGLKTPKGAATSVAHLPRRIADVSKSIGASLDDSFALRQGFKAFFTNNKQWRKEFIDSFGNIARGFKNAEAAQREFKARIMADPLYDQAVKDKLAIIGHEDVFPTSLPGKIPGIGKAFNASEVAYDAFAENLRLGIYKQQLKLAKDLGQDMGEDFGKNIAKEVNSLTGRGGLGRAEPLSGPANLAFYSLRFLKSNVDTLFLHPAGIGVGGIGSVAQKTAAKNLVKIIAGTAAILKTAETLKPGSVDWDPRSTNFGQIKIGDTRFNVSGGMNSIITLAARLASQSTKSGAGTITKLNTGKFGAPTEADIVKQFFENKLSPVGGVVSDTLEGKTPAGTKPTVKSELAKLVTPLNVNNFNELKNDKNSANILAAMLADTFGISTNTYGASSTNWSTNAGAELKAFQKKVGDIKFKQANNEYNKKVSAALLKLTTNGTYKALPNDQKASVVTAAKSKIKAQIFKDYNFEYKRPASSKASSATKKQLLNSL